VERADVGPGRIAEGDVVERQRAARGAAAATGLAGALISRLLGEQLGEPAGGAGAAQQVAIDFGQRAERAGDERAGEHEGGDRAAGDPAGLRRRARLPHQHGDRAEDQAMTIAVITARSSDPAPRGLKARSTASEAAGSRSPGRRPGRSSSRPAPRTIAPTSAIRSWLCARRAGPGGRADDRQDDERDAEQQHAVSFGRQGEQIDDAADAHDDVAQRDRDGRADDLLDDRVSAVSREAISDGRFSSKKRGASRSRLRCTAIGGRRRPARRATRRNRSASGGDRQHDDDQQQIVGTSGRSAPPAAEPKPRSMISLEAVGDGQRRRRGDSRRTAPRDLALVARA
jgi:hypothetical protein